MGAILHILEHAVPPKKKSGGLNRLVYWLAVEQAQRGHKVYVAAPSGQSTEHFQFIRIPRNCSRKDIASKIPEDVTDIEMHQAPEEVANWVLETYPRSIQIMHSGISPEDVHGNRWSGKRTVFVSRSHMERAGGSKFAYNGIPVDQYQFRESKDAYLLFLAKVRRSKKGVPTAIRVAKRCRRKLIVAGGMRKGSPETWFPWHPLIHPIGYIDGQRKSEVLSRAGALLNPIRWEEPFGLTVVEAMISGTPVIAFKLGAMPELIVDGVTGFLCDTEDDMVNAIAELPRLSPNDCRQHAEEHFSATAMYLKHMELLELAGSGVIW